MYGRYGKTVEESAEKDYPGQGVFKDCDIPSIDLDSYEISCSGSNDCTSDGVIGIADVAGCRLVNPRLLLTELRIGYGSAKNLDFQNIRQKYVHSSDILHEFDPDKRIDREFALIFRPSVRPLAQRRFWSWAKESARKSAGNWMAYDPESFCNHVNYGKALPLSPSAATEAKVMEWCSKTCMGYIELDALKNDIEGYLWTVRGRRQTADLDYISNSIASFLATVVFPSGEEGELCRLLKREIEEMAGV